MKKSIGLVMGILATGTAAMLLVQCKSNHADGQQSTSGMAVTVHLDEERQVIDGFGVSEADWADDVFIFPKRDEVLDRLFSKDGLALNILRGEVFPHYSPDSLHFDFATESDISDETVQNAAELERNDLLRRGQYWLSSEVAQKYPDVRFMFTTWSPPAWMKEGGHATELYPASHGSLMKSHYQSFADYLTLFYKEFQKKGIDIYAISPSNEPGYAAPWNSCIWTPQQMGEFIHDYLLPTFEKNGVDAKVIFGENPSWSVTSEKFHNISSELFVNAVLEAYPDLDKEEVIAGGHGYELPDYLPLPAEEKQNPIIPFKAAYDKGIHMWVTEMSDINSVTLSMADGLHWASAFSDYLMDAHVSAILWWLGAQPTTTNESLIVLNNEEETYAEAKRFDAMGNYSRYIQPGSICIGCESEDLPEGVKVAAFKKDKEYTLVIVNPEKEEIELTLSLDGGKIRSDLNSYTTTADLQWQEGKVSRTGGKYILTLPAESVVTYTGNFR